jgi:hypothetical protein
MAARAPETGSAPRPNRAVFPIPPPLPDKPAANDPGQPATVAERSRPTSASTASGSMEDELMMKVRQAAEAAAAKQARVDKDSDGPWLKIVTILILVAIGVAGLKAEYGRSNRPQFSQGAVTTSAPENMDASDAAVPSEQPQNAISTVAAGPLAANAPANTPNVIQSDACTSFAEGMTLPDNYLLLAAGAYAGKKVGFQIDRSGEEATQIDVTVNSPEEPVVLLLGARSPTIWNISRTSNTQVLGVLATGYERQAVAGLDRNTPLLVSTHENEGPCGFFFENGGSEGSANAIAQRAFGRPVDQIYQGSAGTVVIGRAVRSSELLLKSFDRTPESFRDKSTLLAGRAGLDEALRKGVLRLTSDYDWQAWSGAVTRDAARHDLPPVSSSIEPTHFSAYVVVRPFTFPTGLHGADAATFFVPEGVPLPDGDPGHSMVYAFDNRVCQGASLRDSFHLVCPASKAR